ncbi:MAG: hypothetical protein KIH69_000800 [Anaerolineae bacterium]|nr:hypothetical protein [Anaerolineae bacterium]
MSNTAWNFVGTWIGETQFDSTETHLKASPAHLWEIRQWGDTVSIESRWEGEDAVAQLNGLLSPDQKSFVYIGDKRRFEAHLLDTQHFIIPEWDTNDIRGYTGPDYDVVFSRPGVAELTAHAAWLKYKRNHAV